MTPAQTTAAEASWLTLARVDPNAFMPYVLRDEMTQGRIVQGKPHLLWHKIIDKYPRVIIWSHVRGGKCEAAGARIALPDGRHEPVENLEGQRLQLRILDPETFEPRDVGAHVTPNGVKPVYEVTLRSGRVYRLTDEHPLLSPLRWVQAKDLKEGEWIACARRIPGPATPNDLGVAEAALMGYVTGDGTAGQQHRCGFTNADLVVVEDVRAQAATRGWHVSLHAGSLIDYSIARPSGVGGWGAAQSPWQWLLENDMAHGAHDKRIPQRVFGASDEAVGAFVGAYFTCDGHVKKEKNGLEISSVSRGLLDDLQLLLLRFGIQATIAPHFDPEFPPWRLFVNGQDAVDLFEKHCRVVGAKVDELVGRPRPTRRSSSGDVVPGVWRSLYHRPLTAGDGSRYDFDLQSDDNHREVVRRVLQDKRTRGGCSSMSETEYEKRFGVRNARRAEEMSNPAVARLASEGVFWDRVVSVELKPAVPTWAIEVLDPAHCYLSSGAVSHNTAQIAVGRVLYELGKNPSLRVGVVSSTVKNALKITRLIGAYIETSEPLHKVFPELRHQHRIWSAQSYTIKRPAFIKGPSVQAVGQGSSVQGDRIDLWIVDDMLNYDNTRTPAQRENLITWAGSTLMSRLEPGTGRVIIVGNAFHPDDLLHTWAKQEGWKAFRFPVLDDKGVPTWDFWTPEKIESMRIVLGSDLEFARSMLCIPRTDADSRFQESWINLGFEVGKDYGFAPSYKPKPHEVVITGVDLAVKRKATSDETTFVTIVFNRETDVVRLLNIEAGKFTADVIIDIAAAHLHRYNGTLSVEDNGAQDFMIQFMKRLIGNENSHASGWGIAPSNRIHNHSTQAKNKYNPTYGVEGVAVDLSQARIALPGRSKLHPQMMKLVSEMLFYSPDAHTGDRLMGFWIAFAALRRRRKTRLTMLDVMSR